MIFTLCPWKLLEITIDAITIELVLSSCIVLANFMIATRRSWENRRFSHFFNRLGRTTLAVAFESFVRLSILPTARFTTLFPVHWFGSVLFSTFQLSRPTPSAVSMKFWGSLSIFTTSRSFAWWSVVVSVFFAILQCY